MHGINTQQIQIDSRALPDPEAAQTYWHTLQKLQQHQCKEESERIQKHISIH